ncbi:MAG TPA: hypothetical protein VGI26_09320 [Solirubrobacteraceae bacterium]
MSVGPNTTIQGSAPKGVHLSRGVLVGAVVVAALVGIAAVLLIGRGSSTGTHVAKGSAVAASTGSAGITHTTAGASASVKPAGSSSAAYPGHSKGTPSATGAGHTGQNATAGKAVAVAEVRDPEEAKSFPLPASTRHASASTPSVAGESAVAAGAASDAQIRKELGEEEKAKASERAAQQRVLTPVAGGFSVGGNGTIPIPQNVPEAVQRVIAGGNAIADFPYIWGGGHASFVANGYDCSGSVSYALAAGGLLNAPLVSGDLASWGAPGPGKWITIYANSGHTFMDVDGMWFDTAGRSGPYASRWLVSTPPLEGYAVRHPVGY